MSGTNSASNDKKNIVIEITLYQSLQAKDWGHKFNEGHR